MLPSTSTSCFKRAPAAAAAAAQPRSESAASPSHKVGQCTNSADLLSFFFLPFSGYKVQNGSGSFSEKKKNGRVKVTATVCPVLTWQNKAPNTSPLTSTCNSFGEGRGQKKRVVGLFWCEVAEKNTSYGVLFPSLASLPPPVSLLFFLLPTSRRRKKKSELK